MSILIAGDFAPIRRYEVELSKGATDFMDSQIVSEINKNELFVVNLEAPLAQNKIAKRKALPQLIAHPDVVKGMKELKIDICSLGNNHILDAGYEGLETTIETLKTHNISNFGVGFNSNDSKKLLVKKVKDKKIGFYAISNNEFSVATETTPGANPENIVDWYHDIPRFKAEVDYLIIFYHTGVEKNIYPTPNIQKKARLLIDLGADFITFQHSHVLGTFETYKNKKIVYGQGDFVFDYGVDVDDFRKFGSLIKLDFIENKIQAKIILFKKKGIQVHLLDEKEREKLEIKMNAESDKILDLDFLQKTFNDRALAAESKYMNLFLSFGNYYMLKVLNKLDITNKLFSKSFSKILLNVVQNDVHRNVLVKILKRKI